MPFSLANFVNNCTRIPLFIVLFHVLSTHIPSLPRANLRPVQSFNVSIPFLFSEMKSSVVKSNLLLKTVCLDTPQESKKFCQPGMAPWKRVVVHQRHHGKPSIPCHQTASRDVKRASASSGSSKSVFLEDMVSSSPMYERPVRGVLYKQGSPRKSVSPARRVSFTPNRRR